MKKFLIIFAAVMVVFPAITFLLQPAEAQKTAFGRGTSDEIERAKQISLQVLRDRMMRRGNSNADELEVKKVNIDELRMAHTRVHQSVRGIPVWESEAIVHLRPDGEVSTVTDNLKGDILVSTVANFSAKYALKLANQMYDGAAELTERPKVDMWVFRGEDRDHLTY
ncbi:MAG TPA: hypothetical protein VK892_04340, partial [Pyrinomonadaceae bacterium]|nr:hypothetical protein [Pyrinomonadaceae bacterium]